MNKIRVIDLLNKIANGEEVPKKIKYCDEMFLFTGYNSASKNYNNELEDLFEVLDGSMLNDEVEIIEEEKKIPEKLDIRQEKNIKNNWKWKVYGKEHSYNISTPQKIIADKLNEVIDTLEILNDKIK